MKDNIRRFLIVDDQEDVTLLMMRILAPYGECVCTNDPCEAERIFERQLKNGAPFDAVFMDIMMPDLDGHQASKALRDVEKRAGVAPGRESRLVMISSLDDTKTVCTSFFKAGCADGYLKKPLSAEGVREQLQELGLLS